MGAAGERRRPRDADHISQRSITSTRLQDYIAPARTLAPIDTLASRRAGIYREMRRLTIRDVAKYADVSVGTVSNALNRPELLAAETHTRVMDAIEELGFVRNAAARQLRDGSSSAIGLVVLHVDPFFNEVTRGVEAAARASDHLVVLCDSAGDVGRESRQLRLLEEQRVAGVLMTPARRSSSRLAREIRKRGTPIVLLDRRSARRDQCSVSVDDVQGGELAADHLVDLGHRRIALINGPSDMPQNADRRKGFVAGLALAGLGVAAGYEIEVDAPTIDAGETAARRLLALRRPPSAIFCTSDLMALGTERAILAEGLDIPGDVAVIGYDDVPFAAMALVPLTSIKQPAYNLGYRAAELLLNESTNTDHKHEQVVFTPELIVRSSTLGSAATNPPRAQQRTVRPGRAPVTVPLRSP